jgi:hypothetical protein
MVGYSELPSRFDSVTNISLQAYEQFGNSVDHYQDLDKNNIHEIIVGAPGRASSEGTSTGAFYILFPRRRRHHPRPFDYRTYYLILCVPTGTFFVSCICSIIYFFYFFRRKPDDVEIIIKKSGLSVDPSKDRNKYIKKNIVYIEEYPV